ncbi:hypothetical protein [Streptomyces sp. NPDC089799]|uniref:hypothetical protein n=1 Tax=Streptomyces sp. NPDC089799 TaxID=3155066 RepID=UPI00343D7B47
MRFTIEGASPEFERKLLALFAEHREELTLTADTGWTVARADRYLRTLPAAARAFALTVIDTQNGVADADELRELLGSLRGATIALSRAVPRGVKAGWWPQGTPAPIQPVYDPDNPSWQRAISYVMDQEYLPAFREAAGLFRSGSPVSWTDENRGGVPARMQANGTEYPAEQTANHADAEHWSLDAPSALAHRTDAGWWAADDVPSALNTEEGENK